MIDRRVVANHITCHNRGWPGDRPTAHQRIIPRRVDWPWVCVRRGHSYVRVADPSRRAHGYFEFVGDSLKKEVQPHEVSGKHWPIKQGGDRKGEAPSSPRGAL